MSSERYRKRIDEKVGMFDKLKVAFTPGDTSEKNRTLESIADQKIREEEEAARLEAMRRRQSKLTGG